MADQRRLIGYVTVREFAGFRLPVPVQNLVLRNYSQTVQLSYALPQCEHKYRGSFMQLFTTLHDAAPDDHVAMCSTAMLPPAGALREEALSLVRAKRVTLHFVFDRLIVAGDDDVRRFEDAERIAGEVRRVDGAAVGREVEQFLRQHGAADRGGVG